MTNKEWNEYKATWLKQIKKHHYDEVYAINLWDTVYHNMHELPLDTQEAVEHAQMFSKVWNEILTQVKNYNINKRWTKEVTQ